MVVIPPQLRLSASSSGCETPVLGVPRGLATEVRVSPEQTQAQVEAAGFELEKVANLPPYHYGSVFVRDAPRTVK